MRNALVLGACSGAMAFMGATAHAQSANPVTIYGFVNANVETVEAKGAGGGIPARSRVSNNLTVLGFKGTEDLGGGIKALFQLETPFPVDSESSAFATRDSGVGFITPGGTVILGRWMTPFKYGTNFVIDPFANNTIAGINGIMGNGFGQGGNGAPTSSFDRRQANTVQYWSPNIGGFNARLMYGANEERSATTNPDMWSALVSYVNGPLYAALACERHNSYFAAGTTDEACRVAGTYSLGGLSLRGSYEQLQFQPTTSTEVKRKAWFLGAIYTAGRHVVRFSYVDALKSTGNATVAVGGIGAPGGDTAARQVVLSYAYALSKRTEVYAFGVKIDNGRNAVYNVPTNPLIGLAAGQDPQGIGIGMKIIF